MPCATMVRRVSTLFLCVMLFLASCAVGATNAGSAADDPSRPGDDRAAGSGGAGSRGHDGGAHDATVAWGAPATECDAGDAVSDCACQGDSDGDGLVGCDDPCPFDVRPGTARGPRYADCDGDGEASATPVQVCGTDEVGLVSPCMGALQPSGGWLAVRGHDCNDEDPSADEPGDWYADCDGDGEPTAMPTRGCGITGALSVFDCKDGSDPDGGFWSIAGHDCDDELSTNPCACDARNDGPAGSCTPIVEAKSVRR